MKKQLDIHVGYWSDVHNKVIVVYLESFFMGHATAIDLQTVMMKFLAENNLKSLQSVAFLYGWPKCESHISSKYRCNF